MNVGLIFAGGTGTRMNTKTRPKQFLQLYGKEIIIYTLEHFNNHPQIDAIAVVCLESWIPFLKELLVKYRLDKVRWVVPGGNSGQQSIYNGLKAVYDDAENPKDTVVLIHDGVRPLINSDLITDNIASVRKNGSSVTTVPAIETIAMINKETNEITGTVNRSDCFIARAPQGFFLDEIMENHNKAIAEGRNDFIDSVSLMKHYGHSLFVVNGPMENIKITTPSDYYIFKAFIELQNNSDVFGI